MSPSGKGMPSNSSIPISADKIKGTDLFIRFPRPSLPSELHPPQPDSRTMLPAVHGMRAARIHESSASILPGPYQYCFPLPCAEMISLYFRFFPPRVEIRHVRRDFHGKPWRPFLQEAFNPLVRVLLAAHPKKTARVDQMDRLRVRLRLPVPKKRLAEGNGNRRGVFHDLPGDGHRLVQYLFLWHHIVEKAGTRFFGSAKDSPRIYPLCGLGDPDDPWQEPR
jgi:hypothetical protein